MLRRFSKSLGIRHLVCGSCNGCEHEMNALAGPDYDITREGWSIVASPRHADGGKRRRCRAGGRNLRARLSADARRDQERTSPSG